MQLKTFVVILLVFSLSCDNRTRHQSVTKGQQIDVPAEDPYRDLKERYFDAGQIPGVVSDIRYATEKNFTGKNLYGDFNKCLLHPVAFKMLTDASGNLQKIKPGYKIVVFDCLRPRRIQRQLFDVVKGTDQEIYVANPKQGSVHNYGFAVDLSLLDENGHELDMGTEYDAFDAASRPDRESQFLASGRLSTRQVENRKLLRNIMEKAGFRGLSIEWWHFNALPIGELRKKYSIVE